MNKNVIVGAIAMVLVLFALLTPYKTSDGFTHKGLPAGYYKSIDTQGLCIGFTDEKPSDITCGKRSFPLNYSHLAIDLAVCAGIAIALVYLTDRHSEKDKTS